MGKRGLYPTISVGKVDKDISLMMNFLSLCDGRSSLLEIAERLKVPIWDLYEVTNKLQKHNLIQIDE